MTDWWDRFLVVCFCLVCFGRFPSAASYFFAFILFEGVVVGRGGGGRGGGGGKCCNGQRTVHKNTDRKYRFSSVRFFPVPAAAAAVAAAAVVVFHFQRPRKLISHSPQDRHATQHTLLLHCHFSPRFNARFRYI